MRFAIYERLSDTELSDPELSFSYQESTCNTKVQDLGRKEFPGAQITCKYKDEDTRGWDYQRSGLKQMLTDAQRPDRPFDAIVVFKLDRLVRGAGVWDMVDSVCTPLGIYVWEATNNIDPRSEEISLLRGLQAVIAGQEPKTTKARSNAAMDQNAKFGWQNGGRILFGCRPRIVPREDETKKPHVGLEADPEYAPYVVMIFELFVYHGYGLKKIASVLNEMEVDTPEWVIWKRKGSIGEGPVRRKPRRKGEKSEPGEAYVLPNVWRGSTVRTILRNPKYTGYQMWKRQARRSILDMDTLERHDFEVWNPEEKWVKSEEVQHDQIISVELFEAAQKILKTRTRKAEEEARKQAKVIHTLRGFIRCTICGRRMQAHHANGRVYYRCRFIDEVGESGLMRSNHPKNVFLREDNVLPAIVTWFAERIFGPQRLSKLEAQLADLQKETPDERTVRISQIERRLERVEVNLQHYRACCDRGADPSQVADWINSAVAEREALSEELAALQAELPEPTEVAKSAEYLDRIPDLSDALEQASPEEIWRLFDAFNLEAVFDPGSDSLRVSVDVAAPFGPGVEGRPTSWGVGGVGGGTRTPTGLRPTRPSTLRVYQFRHSDTK